MFDGLLEVGDSQRTEAYCNMVSIDTSRWRHAGQAFLCKLKEAFTSDILISKNLFSASDKLPQLPEVWSSILAIQYCAMTQSNVWGPNHRGDKADPRRITSSRLRLHLLPDARGVIVAN